MKKTFLAFFLLPILSLAVPNPLGFEIIVKQLQN